MPDAQHYDVLGKIALIEIRLLEADDNASLQGKTLRKAIEEDVRKGKIPFYVSFNNVMFWWQRWLR